MPYVFLGLALLVGGILIAYWFNRTDPRQVAKTVKIVAIVLLVGLGILLAVAGRAQVLAALPILAGVLWKLWPLLNSLGRRLRNGGQAGSNVRTRFFAMHLDHASGHVDGDILAGAFAGRLLSDLSLAELNQLRGDVSGDPQSLALIEAYLDRRDPDWRGPGSGDGSRASSSGPITLEEAYDVLGLEPGASLDEIRQAHRRLMQKLHPDAGGSDWLAAKLNAAKDLLLSR